MLVASEQALIAEAVRAALAGKGHEAFVLRWPGEAAGRSQRQRPPVEELDVGLLLSDLDRWSRIRAAALVVERIQLPWAIMTGREPGPAWGALLTAGARVVVSSRTGLDDITALLEAVMSGRLATPPGDRARLEEEWRELRARHDATAERLALLTPREREVLRLLYRGASVARIAEILAVAPETVRSQVKSVLRKLDTSSQLAAVAMFREFLDELETRPTV